MASVDWKKNKGGTNESIARMSHATRHDGKDVEYNNKEINKELTHLNFHLYWTKECEKMTAREEVNRLKKRVAELDKIKPPKRLRKDRVTTCSFVISAPGGLKSREEETKFFRLAYGALTKFCGGKENVSGAYIHYDEVHEYFDPEKKKMVTSRPHMHVQGITWTDQFGVNGKNFETRERLKSLNKTIDERCKKELDISFLNDETSQHDKEWRSVEDLKRESHAALEEANKQLESKNKEIEKLNKIIFDNAKANSDLIKRQKEKMKLQERELNDVSLVDRMKQRLSNNESQRAQKLADELLEERTKELTTELDNAQKRADMSSRELSKLKSENQTLKKENQRLNSSVEDLRGQNKMLMGIVKMFQRAFDFAEKTMKVFGLWSRFKQDYRETNQEEYFEFQSVRHESLFGGKHSQNKNYDLDR